ncbi:ribonuclease H2 subunit C [Patella vulgata]|uniref:ribonuclease H2 subunit C n=1 Tax=Patella vulgata TaxID=6465 RepID=UPI00217FB703|nr:ribonuclease H2 subunit C [Patella vulgata]
MAVQINTETVSTAPEISCHLMPCEIHHNEEANVCKYFETTIRKEEDLITGCMHGRPLNGEEVALPSGYTGLVVSESRKAATEDEDRMMDIKSKFNEFTYWNLDKPTSKEDTLSKALQWIDIANILHSPINQDELSQRSVTGK